ncbi:MAG: phosphoribosylglycinamide formyltransferase 2, partial [Tannerellaceae bacterium]
VQFGNLIEALSQPDTQMRIFGKPEVHGHRRMAVMLARANSVEEARAKANKAYEALEITL